MKTECKLLIIAARRVARALLKGFDVQSGLLVLAEAFILLIRALEQRGHQHPTGNVEIVLLFKLGTAQAVKGEYMERRGFDGGRFFWIQSCNIPNRNTGALLQHWWFLLAQQSKLCGFPWEEIKQELTSATVTALWNWGHLSLREISNYCSGIFWLSSWENHLKIFNSRPQMEHCSFQLLKRKKWLKTKETQAEMQFPRNFPQSCGPAVTQLSWRFHQLTLTLTSCYCHEAATYLLSSFR